MKSILITASLLAATLSIPAMAANEATVVLRAKPSSMVTSGPDRTDRELLSEPLTSKNAVLIVKKGNRFFWATRENRELFYNLSGMFHIFVDIRSGAYVKITRSEYGCSYMEHVHLHLGTITYWGETKECNLD